MSEYYPNLNLPTFSEFGGGEVALIKSVDELKKLVGGVDMTNATLLAHISKPNASSTASQEYEATLSGNLSNYAFLYCGVGSTTWVLGGTFVPMSVFKNTLPSQSDIGYYEMNFINDQQNLFGGNVRYVSDTKVKGKFTGNATWINVYGVGKIS